MACAPVAEWVREEIEGYGLLLRDGAEEALPPLLTMFGLHPSPLRAGEGAVSAAPRPESAPKAKPAPQADYSWTEEPARRSLRLGELDFASAKFSEIDPGLRLLNFNYTPTDCLYINKNVCGVTHIHGELEKPQSIIFGYGDEQDKNYEPLKDLNDNDCLCNIKTSKYLESDNYRNALSFLDYAPFQVYIMGHSCGNSDRTLLNTIFEHKNCISIKPYYYVKEDGTDNYLELIQNISRNFTDMKLMRDRVVNKTYCEPLVSNN